jgi:hypothetical protein
MHLASIRRGSREAAGPGFDAIAAVVTSAGDAAEVHQNGTVSSPPKFSASAVRIQGPASMTLELINPDEQPVVSRDGWRRSG